MEYLQNFHDILLDFHPSKIFNMDETFVKTNYKPKFTIGIKGSENVPSGNNGDDKEGFTALCTISLDGNVFEPIFIETKENEFGNQWQYEIDILTILSNKGWTTEDVMLNYQNNILLILLNKRFY